MIEDSRQVQLRAQRSALVVGASSGIGLALARRLTAAGWAVTGIARRPAGFSHKTYRHLVADVRFPEYCNVLAQVLADGLPDVVVYSTGIGHEFDLGLLDQEADVFTTNLTGLAYTAQMLLPRMAAARVGHLIGISSQGDRVVSAIAPSYAASKAGMSSYLEGLAIACRPFDVAVTNVRLGFVDTAMAKAPGGKPFIVSADRAAQHIERCIRRRPIRSTFPIPMAFLLWFFRVPMRVRLWLS